MSPDWYPPLAAPAANAAAKQASSSPGPCAIPPTCAGSKAGAAAGSQAMDPPTTSLGGSSARAADETRRWGQLVAEGWRGAAALAKGIYLVYWSQPKVCARTSVCIIHIFVFACVHVRACVCACAFVAVLNQGDLHVLIPTSPCASSCLHPAPPCSSLTYPESR